jgi:GTP-binding protein EngB required for normal cell division
MNIFNNVTNNLSQATTNVYGLFNKQDVFNTLSKLSDSKIIAIANEINNIFGDTIKIEGCKSAINLKLPRIVVVGTQSSGKSTVLNSIITMDILPTGKSMTTRTPLEINLSKLEKGSQGFIEFGSYDETGNWCTEAKFIITTPVPTQQEIIAIREHIGAETIKICGQGMNINFKPIIINIFSAFVPNLSLIDLPGLTMLARVDDGQPKDICERIRSLVTSYICQENSIIVAVMQARVDLEADAGLALVKEFDKQGARTIGVLTKPDLMNYDSHIGDYLINKQISLDLMLNYGYYVLKNRNDRETAEHDILKGFTLESEYFASHPEYKKSIYKDKIGIKNLVNSLTKILVSSISEAIPNVMADIIALDNKITHKLSGMGDELPTSKEGKLSVINKYVTNFNAKFIDSIESRGNPLFNAGKNIKEIMIEFRNKILRVEPFYDSKIYDQAYFNGIISSFEGNHMSNHTSPIQILEACMADNNLKPISKLEPHCVQCLDNVCAVLINLMRSTLKTEEFSQYPPLATCVLNNLVENIILKQKILIKEKIHDEICDQEAYIWTDDPEFLKASEIMRRENGTDIDKLRKFLEAYYRAVKLVINDKIPKIIMRGIVRHIQCNALSYLFEYIVTDDKIELLKEDPDVDKERKYYQQIKNRISNVKSSVQKSVTLEP